MPDLRKKFSSSEWKDCCGKGCKKCEIAQAYIKEYGGRSKGLEKLNDDRAVMQAKKSHKLKGRKKKGGKKS